MTMADTIAVMNKGRIEQMGSPVDLYENPETVFVANFLGQSNLIKATVGTNSGAETSVDVQGSRIILPTSRNRSAKSSILVGIRPEKINIHAAGAYTGKNALHDGVVTDISFVGVSTQYQVEMPWKQELMVFEQNDGGAPNIRKGDRVTLSWEPNFTFALDSED